MPRSHCTVYLHPSSALSRTTGCSILNTATEYSGKVLSTASTYARHISPIENHSPIPETLTIVSLVVETVD